MPLNTAWKTKLMFMKEDRAFTVPGLSLSAAPSSGYELLCSSAGACYSPGSAAVLEGSDSPSVPGAE